MSEPTRFINTGGFVWYLGYTHRGQNFVFGLRDLHPDSLFFFETGVKR